MNAKLRVTSFADRRTVELHNRHDEIVRRRFQQRVAKNVEAKRASLAACEVVPFFRRQAM